MVSVIAMLNSRARLGRELCRSVLMLVLGCDAVERREPDAALVEAPDSSLDAAQMDADTAPPEPEGLDFEPSDLDPPDPPGEMRAEPEDEASYLFDPSALRTYELRLSPEALETLDGNAQLEQYVEGSLIFEGQEYAPVGIRYKGSVGAWRGCLGGLRKTCTKLSMKVKLNYEDPDANLFGLRKVLFHSMNNDPSMLKERLGYWLFRAFGVPAPRAVHARLLINGELNGLVALVEDVDGRFTRSRFEEGGKGNLYKEAWPLAADGTAITAEALLPRLETNEDDDPSLERFVRFGKLLQYVSGQELDARLERWLSLDHVMRYLAVDRAIGNDDGVLHWYCLGTPCWNHNFFWYEERDAQRFWLIPWDLDSSFNRDNAITTIWLPWDDSGLECQPVTMAPFNFPLRAPSCDKLIGAWAGLQDEYVDALAVLLDGPYRADAVEQRLSAWETQIAPVVAEAAALHADAVSVEAWQAAGLRLRDAIGELRERAQRKVEETR